MVVEFLDSSNFANVATTLAAISGILGGLSLAWLAAGGRTPAFLENGKHELGKGLFLITMILSMMIVFPIFLLIDAENMNEAHNADRWEQVEQTYGVDLTFKGEETPSVESEEPFKVSFPGVEELFKGKLDIDPDNDRQATLLVEVGEYDYVENLIELEDGTTRSRTLTTEPEWVPADEALAYEESLES